MAFGQFVLTAKFDCGGVFEQNVVAWSKELKR